MSHKHSVYDTDAHFAIDLITRKIANKATTKTALIQYDHNSERFTFEIPRLVDGHDMSLCNKIEVHYINVATNQALRNADVYLVEDMQLSPEDENVVIFSWLISKNATLYAGTLQFLIRFTCLTGEVIDYAWNTAIFSGITISAGINNGEAIVEEYSDTLERWKIELDGESAYDIAVAHGFEGSEEEWLLSLTGAKGDKGDKGDKGEKGDKGADGTVAFEELTDEQRASLKGEAGNGIASIEKTATEGLVDTYTITFTDGKTETFKVTNGKDTEKIYRHDVCIGETYWSAIGAWFTIFNTDPTNYSATAGEVDYDTAGYTPPLTAENFAFIPNARINATGIIDGSGDGTGDDFILGVSNTGTGISIRVVDIENCDILSVREGVHGYDSFEYIQDNVTEVGGTIDDGDEVRY